MAPVLLPFTSDWWSPGSKHHSTAVPRALDCGTLRAENCSLPGPHSSERVPAVSRQCDLFSKLGHIICAAHAILSCHHLTQSSTHPAAAHPRICQKTSISHTRPDPPHCLTNQAFLLDRWSVPEQLCFMLTALWPGADCYHICAHLPPEPVHHNLWSCVASFMVHMLW